jgi:NAD(P)-dependent dehydrogenase (short-subunit alcohol dehydrogenase family)
MQRVLISGCSRGIGLGLVQEFLKHSQWHVTALIRSTKTPNPLKLLIDQYPTSFQVFNGVDITDKQAVHELAETIDKLDMLINNAGIATPNHPHDQPQLTSEVDMVNVFQTNVVGTMLMTQAFLGALSTSSRECALVANISSSLGSIGLNTNGGVTAYRCSKAALNQLTKCFAVECSDVAFVAVDPGWVRTDMGNANGRTADLEVEQSCGELFKTLTSLKRADSGRFINYQGDTLEW